MSEDIPSRALDALACPDCGGAVTGDCSLVCDGCGEKYPVLNGIPRFVADDTYASSFALQWNRHARTQIDRFNGSTISRDRFFGETRWPEDLSGRKILEAGCGAGRFTQVVLDAGAEVWSFDMSGSVDACLENNGSAKNLRLFQADVLHPPFRKGSFDGIFCFGVLQHTPEPRRAFLSLAPLLREGGEIVVDTYNRNSLGAWFHPKYYMRMFARRMDSEKLYRKVRRIVPRLLPISGALRKIPLLGRPLSLMVPVADYRGILPIREDQAEDWAILDTFDWLSPRYDRPQTARRVRGWFAEAGLEDVEVTADRGLIVGRGKKHDG